MASLTVKSLKFQGNDDLIIFELDVAQVSFSDDIGIILRGNDAFQSFGNRGFVHFGPYRSHPRSIDDRSDHYVSG